MAENVFEVVKESVTTREAAEMYGIEVKHGGMACCPFHDDRHPSMKVDRRFHCFGCGADGDVIDFTARLYNLTPKEAAEKLAQDFGLAYDSQAPPRRNYVRQKSETQKLKEKREHGWRVLTDYYHLLRKWETDYSPKTPDEDPHPRFMEAIQKKDYTGYLLDLLIDSSTEEQDKWFAEHSAEITAIEGRVKIMAEKPTNRERLREITEGIEQGIKELFESEKYMRYLSVMSRFHRYSVNNTMLIYMQRPDATLVAGYNKWKNQFERHVKRGEHGITIIAPTPYKKKIEEQKLDPDTKAPMLDKDGKVIMEEKEIEIPLFRPVKVFDVSQTDGKPLPELASSLTGNVQNYEVFLEALRRSAPVPIEFEPMAANMDGYFSSDRQRIALRPGMSEVQTVSAAIHEIAHSKLHDPKRAEPDPAWKVVMVSDGGTRKDYSQGFATEAEAEQFAANADWRYVDENQFEWRLEVEEDHSAEIQAAKDRRTEEVQAESISYAVCQYYGMPEMQVIQVREPEHDSPTAEFREALLVLDDAAYLHIQPCDTGWDYTLYDKETMRELDGGQLDAPDLRRSEAALRICDDLNMGNASIKYAPLSMIETLQEAAYQQMQEQVSQQAEDTAAVPTQLPDAPEQALDEYPMPDPALPQDDLEKCGYLDSDLLPLSKERAYELMERDLTVYIIQEGENPEMAFDSSDLDAHDGIFAVARDEWEESPQFHEKVLERQDRQLEREQAFLSHEGDCFAIYQVSRDDPQNIRFMNMDWLQSHDISVERGSYDLIYTAPLTATGSTDAKLEQLFQQFNLEKPVDFHSPSMSVSDIVALKQNGVVSCHYVDSVGFQQIPSFLPENHLKNAEMTVEDDYGMIDGVINNGSKEPTVAQLEQQARSGQPISLMDLAAAAHREEREKRKSVVEQLRSQPKSEHKKTAHKKSAEREI